MALVQCPDCGTQVSDQAHACINCGRPRDNPPPMKIGAARFSTPDVQTIERTGKDAKGLKLLSNLILVASFILIFANGVPNHTNLAVIGFFIGIPLSIFSRIVIWWKYR